MVGWLTHRSFPGVNPTTNQGCIWRVSASGCLGPLRGVRPVRRIISTHWMADQWKTNLSLSSNNLVPNPLEKIFVDRGFPPQRGIDDWIYQPAACYPHRWKINLGIPGCGFSTRGPRLGPCRFDQTGDTQVRNDRERERSGQLSHRQGKHSCQTCFHVHDGAGIHVKAIHPITPWFPVLTHSPGPPCRSYCISAGVN